MFKSRRALAIWALQPTRNCSTPLTSRNKFLQLSTMSYSTPTSFYDVLPDEFFSMPYTNQFGSQTDSGSNYFPPIGGELTPAYPMYTGPSLLQNPPSLPSTSSSIEFPASGNSSWGQSSGPLSDDLS